MVYNCKLSITSIRPSSTTTTSYIGYFVHVLSNQDNQEKHERPKAENDDTFDAQQGVPFSFSASNQGSVAISPQSGSFTFLGLYNGHDTQRQAACAWPDHHQADCHHDGHSQMIWSLIFGYWWRGLKVDNLWLLKDGWRVSWARGIE